MKSIKILILTFLLFLSLPLLSQSRKKQTYFVVKNDTTFCKKLSFGVTIQGYLYQMSYTTRDGKKVELKGRKNVPDVTSFCIKDSIMDKLPLKLSQPNRYIRYTYKPVHGKLSVYSGQQGSLNGDATGLYRFFIRMPDGNLYKINNNKNRKNIIIPYLLKCEAFKEAYKGDFNFNRDRFVNEDNFIAMIKLYNSVCDSPVDKTE